MTTPPILSPEERARLVEEMARVISDIEGGPPEVNTPESYHPAASASLAVAESALVAAVRERTLREVQRKAAYARDASDSEAEALTRFGNWVDAEVEALSASPTPGGESAAAHDVLRTLTPEELATFEPISQERIDEALEQGRRARERAMRPTLPAPASPPASDGKPTREECLGCAKVARHPGEGYECGRHGPEPDPHVIVAAYILDRAALESPVVCEALKEYANMILDGEARAAHSHGELDDILARLGRTGR